MPMLSESCNRMIVAVRRAVARRPWVNWVAIGCLSIVVMAGLRTRLHAVDEARAGWGETASVWVAAGDIDVGEPLETTLLEVPISVLPERAVSDSPAGTPARRQIGRGEIVTDLDVMPDGVLAGLTPDGWLVTPVEESPASGAALGDRVQVASGGFVLAQAAVVVGFTDQVTLIAVPAEIAPLVPAAAETGRVTLLRMP